MATTGSKLNETSREYNSISADLLAAIPNITEEWTPSDETDPGLVYLKVAAMLGDMLSYNRDRAISSIFPDSVLERQDAYRLFNSLGYKMKWYRPATCRAKIAYVGATGTELIIPKYTMFASTTNSIPYTYVGDTLRVMPSSQTDLTNIVSIKLVQGEPITPPIVSSQYKIPTNQTATWHSVYSYNITKVNILQDVFIRLSDYNVGEGTITLIDDKGYEWKETKDVASVEDGKYFELCISNFNSAYIRLSANPETFGVSKFKLFYLRTNGKSGRITGNVLGSIPVTSTYIFTPPSSYSQNTSSNIRLSNDECEGGYDYETAEEARDNFERYGKDTQTLITTEDFKTQIEKSDSVYNCSVYDVENCSETFNEYIGALPTTGSIRRYLRLSKANVGTSKNIDIYLSSIRVYNGNTLVFSGVKDGDTPGTEGKYKGNYYLKFANDYKPVGGEFSKTSYIKYDPENTEIAINIGHEDFTIEGQSVPVMSAGDYWMQFRVARPSDGLGININKDSDYTKEETIEIVNSTIDDKKHIHLQPNIYFNPYVVEWQPNGEIFLNRNVSYQTANQIMSNIYLALQERFKEHNMQVNELVDAAAIKNKILADNPDVNNVINPSVDYKVEVYGDMIYGNYSTKTMAISNALSNGNSLSKKITIQLNNVVGVQTGTTIEYDLNIGEYFTIKPNTLKISINNGDIVLRDKVSTYDPSSTTSKPATTPSTASIGPANYGNIISESAYFVDSDNFVLYDTFSTRATAAAGAPVASSDCNIMFKLTNTSYRGGINVAITFESDFDFVCKLNGYDSSKFYIHPSCIDQYSGGENYDFV